MLHNIKELNGFTIAAEDGDLGSVKDVLFDDERWVVRYLVVDTGGWLDERRVLVSPRAVKGVDWGDQSIAVKLTRQQVRDSPDINTDQPVSRQYESDYSSYYGYPPYWNGANLWGLGIYPIPWVAAGAHSIDPVSPGDQGAARELRERREHERETADSHLRSSSEVEGYDVGATDGAIGEVDDFVLDDRTWAIRYIVVDTRKWWPGKHVIVSPQWIDRVSWPEHSVYVNVTREAVKASPEYDRSHPLSREEEDALYRHHARPVYWE
jgi:uncharacterized protein YrrD